MTETIILEKENTIDFSNKMIKMSDINVIPKGNIWHESPVWVSW